MTEREMLYYRAGQVATERLCERTGCASCRNHKARADALEAENAALRLNRDTMLAELRREINRLNLMVGVT